jgi:segregation and condensation protein B
VNDGAREEARRAIEAILMVADEPVDAHLLAQLVEISPAELSALMAELAGDYQEQGRGFVLTQIAGGYRFQSDPDMAPYVERFVLEGQSARLSSAAMETMAIIAYKQPISRAQVAAIRGVNVDGVVRTLEQRGYIAEVARDAGPGQAVLFGTTPKFLERMGINAIEDLPPVADFVPGAEVIEALELGLRVSDDDDEVADGGDATTVEEPAGPGPQPTIDIDNL